MKKTQGRYSALNRALALLLAFVMVAGYFPNNIWTASATAANGITTVADPQTLTRPETIYGDNTLNAGKVTVGKSVSTQSVTVNGKNVPLNDPDNFLVTITQTAQVMGLSSETSVPVDVVFVLDTSGSMEGDRAKSMVNAANAAIKSLMEANKDNRVSVVAFSSAAARWDGEWTDWGQGTSNGAAANVLSPLAHYDDNTATATTADDAASNHLRWANSSGTASTNGAYLLGRGSGTVSAGYRRGNHEDAGGTNIHAGIALGAQQLMKVTDTTVTYEGGTTINRMPFIVVLSDGAPTFASSSTDWYNPSQTAQNGDGNNAYTGNGFLAALTAAYYKGAITDHYYGSSADNSNRCNIYTIGVSVGNNTLANLTLNPKENFNASATGNGHGGRFASYWSSYNRNNLTNGFTVEVNDDQNFRLTNTTISATKNFVTGKNANGTVMYSEGTGITYNDGFYSATQTSQIAGIFDDIVAEISKKAISAPTKVDSYGADFSGYVTFTDPIGEYMEVKDMKGIIADGNFYKGSTAAQYMADYGTDGQNADFNALMEEVLTTRMSMTASSGVTMADLMATAEGNSITWWGKTYTVSGEEDVGMQVIAAAEDDSVDYITSTTAPAGADHVCRSYFFYGTAGSTVENPNHEYLYFVIRVQRSLKAPYQQTVVVSAPASLLSMEKVLITESKDDEGKTVYTAAVEEAQPARVVYEVGLRSDITAENVEQIVTEDYKNETVNGAGSLNYDPATDSYNFFTNDWDRSESTSSHHRALAKATFDAAADNAFYTYQEDTLIVNASGNAVTADPKGTTAYYVRTYYEWGTTADENGEFTATQKTKLIEVDIPSDATLVQKDGKWYIPKGAHTGATLVVNGDDTTKSTNATGTAAAVAHPHRTGNQNNSHYTVLLGNNGKLTLKANTPEPKKTVQVGNIVDADGKEVKVGDELTYTVSVKNALDKAAEYTITDKVPAGTAFVSADNGGTEKDGTVTWKVNIPAGQTLEVKMVVQVTKDALNTAVVSKTIKNTAVVTFPNGAQYSTNPVENPPYGKVASDASGNDTATQSGYKVGDIITYSIRYHNNAKNDQGEYVDADITITDMVPEGTELVANNPISHGGTTSVNADGRTVITWNFKDVAANAAGVVTFQVKITADAVSPVTNSADITVGNNPTVTTNPTETKLFKGNLVLTKTVAEGDDQTKEFTLTLTESTGKLNGTFGTVTFQNGYASVTIKHGQTVTVPDLPAGVKITVAELAPDGWTATYDGKATAQEVTIAASTETAVNINNDYHASPVTFQLKGTKTFVGDTFPAGATFTFRAVQCDANGNVLSNDPITVTATVTSPNGDIVFSQRVFTAAFQEARYYKITEDASNIEGLITDSSEYLLYLNVTDNGEGDLELTYSLSKDGKVISSGEKQPGNVTVTGADFTNIYPESTSITLGGDKTLTGRYQTAGEFSFQLLVPGNNTVGSGSATVIGTASNVVNKDNAYNSSFTFEPITYTARDMVNADGTIATEKTFYYYIREIPGQNADITYDPAHYVVTVTVKNVNGKLEASKTIVKYENAGSDTAADVNKVSFGNIFKVQDTRVTLTGTKVLTGRALKDGEFSFSVYKADENGDYTETENQIASGVNKADGTIAFSPIGFTIADMGGAASKDFYFVVKENMQIEGGATVDPNMYYDPTEYLVKVTVTYDASKGTLTAGTPEVVNGGNSITFNNIQNPSTITVTPVGTKKITGSSLPTGLSFSFKVIPVAGGQDAATGTSTPITDSYTADSAIDVGFTSMVYSYDLWNANKDDSGVATFRYWILESNTGSAGNGVDYTTVRYLYEVKLSRTATNALVTTETYYKQNEGVADGNTDPANYTTQIATYTSTQDATARAAFVNTVKNAVVFTNNYYAETQINLTATKQMNGIDLEGKDFDFLLQRLDPTGKIIPDSKTSGSNDENGNITFATLNYSSTMLTDAYQAEDGCYYFSYLLTEVKPEGVAIPGVKYDETKYIVTVKITQTPGAEGAAGTLTAELAGVSYAVEADGKYTPGSKVEGFTAAGSTNVTFTNTYSVQKGTEVTIEATKTLTGRDFVMGGENEDIGEFGFALYRYSGKDAEGKEIWRNIGTAFNAADGKIRFTREYKASNLTHIAFDDNNEYRVLYRIDEINGGLGGVEYSKKQYFVEVIVVHDQSSSSYSIKEGWPKYYETMSADGTLSDEVNASDVVFENKYKTNDTSFKPTASKELKVWDAETQQYTNTSAGGFSFEVVEVDANGDPIMIGEEGKQYAKVVATGHSIDDGTVTFDDVIFNGQTELTHQGEIDCPNAEHGDNCEYHKHYYMIRENAGTAAGITYDTKNYYITVEIHDNGAGELRVENVKYYSDKFQKETDTVLFTNHYGPGSVNLDLQVNKVVEIEYPQQAQTFALRGTPVIDPNAKYEMAGSEFDFEVYAADESFNLLKDADDKYIVVASGTNGKGTGSATVPFSTITYTRKDAYENGVVKSGQKSSQTYYYVIKELVPSEGSVPGVNIDTKEIHVTVTVSDDGYGNMTATAVYANDDKTFTNTYEVKDPITVTLTAVKELIGKDMENFTFLLKDDEGNVLSEKQNDGTTVTFDALTFYQPGTYTYTVSEVKDTNEHMTYDTTVYTVTIQVWDDREGKLYTEIIMHDGSNAVELMKFTNTYKHPDLEVDLSEQINADKTAVGPNGDELSYLLQKYQFRFEVIDLQGNPVKDADGNDMIGVTDEDGNITFPSFKFETAGEYHYLIREVEGYADRKITTDDQVWCAHIKVVYNRETGLLEIDPAGCTTHLYHASHDADQEYNNPVFVNEYDPETVSVTVKASKELLGRELKNHEFTFRLLDENGYIAAEAKNHTDGSITFQLDYELADLAGKNQETFTYKLVEVTPDSKLGGVTYTNMAATVKVTVTDNQEGKLTAVVTGNGATFTNEYNADDVTAVIEAVKLLEGKLLAANDFSFYLKDADGNTVKDADGNDLIVKNDADGKIRFELNFTQDMLEKDEKGNRIPKEFTYTIHEVKGALPGVTYDEGSFAVTVTVRDNFQGQLTATTVYADGVVPTFVNVYETDDALVTIQATKELTGKNLAGDDFEFQLLDEEGNVVATAKNDADGNIRFDFTLTKAGDYTFTIVEVAHEDDHYSHDESIYKVTVKVNDNGEGKLIAEAPVYEKTPVFQNTYTPDGIQVTVEASKLLSGGKTLKGNDFEFQLLDAENKVVATAKNTAEGKITFQLDVAEEGTCTYTMVEKASGNDRITDDTSKFTVTIKVTNDNGVLKAAVTYGTEGGKAPVFQNTWKPEKIGITLTGSKTLTGRDMKAGEFKFQVHDTTGTLVATGTNDAKGKITFTPVGIVTKGTYLLTVSEVKGSAEYVTYDKTTFQVKVVVENVDGVLVPAVTYLDGDIAFENSYDEPNNPETGDNSPIYWMVGLLVISGMAIVLLIALRPKKKGGKYAK